MELLDGPIRGYAWGSYYALAELTGRAAPTEDPEAELWLGAHPASPAMVMRSGGGIPLNELIAADPEGNLGAGAVARFGQRLPFLLKVLAAAQPLSLQAHPDLDQARAGFEAEEAAQIPLGAAGRTYVDPWHKPEILVAVSDFEALCGFADPQHSRALLAALGVPELDPVLNALALSDPGRGLRDATHLLLTYPEASRADLVSAVVSAARHEATRDDHYQPGQLDTYQLLVELAQRYPGDVGVVVAALLNRVRLRPGEAVWMPAGNLHAYLCGVGIELMAASDNVLRGGLTPKHVNVPELLRVLRFEVLADPVVKAEQVSPGVVTWPVPVPDFALHRAVLTDRQAQLPGSGPRILLCRQGTARCCASSQESLVLRAGQSAFVPAAAGPVVVEPVGGAELYQASL